LDNAHEWRIEGSDPSKDALENTSHARGPNERKLLVSKKLFALTAVVSG
jgi:hypothetical protein